MRCLGVNYSYTGDILRNCTAKNFIKRIERKDGKNKKEKYLRITKEGLSYLSKFPLSYDLKTVLPVLKKYVDTPQSRVRELKLSWTVSMLYRYCPDFIFQYISVLLKDYNINSHLTAKEKILNEIKTRNNNSKSWMILTRELRCMDSQKLRTMSSVRALGLFHTTTGNYVFYNSMSNRIISYFEYEEKFQYFISSFLHDGNLKLFIFGKSYKVAIDTVKSTENERKRYLFGNRIYKQQYYIPLTSDGAKQIEIFTITNFRLIAREALINKEDEKRAKNLIYDGEAKSGNLLYIGFECELNEIQDIFDILSTIKISKTITVFCFKWQANFYHSVFGEQGIIKTVDFKPFLDFIKGENNEK